MPNSFEPGDGRTVCDQFGNCRSNFTGLYDDVRDDLPRSYNDHLFFDLCGPGAADIALEYWPWPPNLRGYTVREPVNGVTTTWNGTDRDSIARARGYMFHLAYEIQPPSSAWPRPGLNMQGNGSGTGATLSTMRDALNWEASGEGSLGAWASYFYVDFYTGVVSGDPNRNNHGALDLHAEVKADVADNVPVVVMVNTNGLVNWGFSGNVTHFITIIGYNDDTGTYTYTDTCAGLTGCGSQTNGQIQEGSQSTLFNNTYGWDW